MSDRDALLAGLLAQPDDDTPRLIYADWLEENGDPDRGEFIRVEIELARTPPGTGEAERRRCRLLDRRTELLRRKSSEWLKPFLPHAREPVFERGFIQSLSVPAYTYLKHAERWLQITPLRRVKFLTCSVSDEAIERFFPWTGLLFDSPLFARLQEADLEHCRLSSQDILLLSQLPKVNRLKELQLCWNSIDSTGAIALAGMPQLRMLESLNLVGNRISDPGIRAIAQSPYLENLKELRISRNPMKKRSWTMLELRFGMALLG